MPPPPPQKKEKKGSGHEETNPIEDPVHLGEAYRFESLEEQSRECTFVPCQTAKLANKIVVFISYYIYLSIYIGLHGGMVL